ncbi:MAG: hypothetical protein KAS32_08645 [Candidatus Peribacteraceae bacterium]|nr:hypothetical protein [Candidatus Peribacteraceae bacterium]
MIKKQTNAEILSDLLYESLEDLNEAQDFIAKVYPKGKFRSYKWNRVQTAINAIRDCVGALPGDFS